MKRFVSSILFLLVCLGAGAQRIAVNPKFGAVSDAEVDMTVYEPDTSAVALMLYRSYDLDLVFDSNIAIVQEITVHERIKVLKEEGKKYADFSFLYLNTTDIKEKYSGVKVETYNRENGKVVKTKMSKKYEFDEKYSDDARRLSFTADPVNETDVTVGHCEYFRINKSQRGYILPAYRSDNRIKQTSVDGGRLSYQVEMDCYHAVDLPAMQSESFSYCPTQYRTQLLYDLSGVSIPGSVYKDYSATWNDVDKAIAESSIFDEVKAKFRDAKELEAALQGVEGDEARIVAVRKYVTDKVKWDEKSRLVPKGAREVLKQGSGSDADINALTASALNAVGYLAEPVMIRRRSEGVLVDFHASINAFDTFIIKVTTPDASKNWYLDAAAGRGLLEPAVARVLRDDVAPLGLVYIEILRMSHGDIGLVHGNGQLQIDVVDVEEPGCGELIGDFDDGTHPDILRGEGVPAGVVGEFLVELIFPGHLGLDDLSAFPVVGLHLDSGVLFFDVVRIDVYKTVIGPFQAFFLEHLDPFVNGNFLNDFDVGVEDQVEVVGAV